MPDLHWLINYLCSDFFSVTHSQFSSSLFSSCEIYDYCDGACAGVSGKRGTYIMNLLSPTGVTVLRPRLAFLGRASFLCNELERLLIR